MGFDRSRPAPRLHRLAWRRVLRQVDVVLATSEIAELLERGGRPLAAFDEVRSACLGAKRIAALTLGTLLAAGNRMGCTLHSALGVLVLCVNSMRSLTANR